MIRLAALLSAGVLSLSAPARPEGCEEFDSLVARTYGFHVATLSKVEQDAKVAAMDAVWALVRAQKRELLPCLRAAITARTNDPYFQFDGSALLLSLDSSRASKQLQVSILANVDLRDVSPQEWIRVAARRAVEGFNTAPAALHWMDAPDSVARYFLPEHGAFEVKRGTGALFLFGSLPETLATPALMTLARSADRQKREIAVGLLMRQATTAARDSLRALAGVELSAEVRTALDRYLANPVPVLPPGDARGKRGEYTSAFRALRNGRVDDFLRLTDKYPNGEIDAAKLLVPDDLADVRYARRFFVASGTPEAVDYYAQFTMIIEAVTARAAKR